MELWRDIPGYEGRYQVSDQGRVRSAEREVVCLSRHGTPHPRLFKSKVLAVAPHPAGYSQCALYVQGVQFSYLVHRLVALTFHGPCPEGHEVLHKNHNKKDNRASNLKYGTRGENVAMDYAAGTRTVHPGFIGARWRAAA